MSSIEKVYKKSSSDAVVRLPQIQSMFYDALSYFHKFCISHDINYFLMWGSLLGCVRNSGIIPWDDDVDLAMSREDFEKLSNSKSAFDCDYYSLLSYKNNKEIPCNEIRIYLKNVFRVFKTDGPDFCANVAIDVFAYDPIPINPKIQNKTLKKVSFWLRLLDIKYCNRKSSTRFKGIGRKIVKIVIPSSFAHWRIDYIRRKCSGSNDGTVAFFDTFYSNRLVHFDPMLFEATELRRFGPLCLFAPKNPEPILSCVYGDDWMKPYDRSNGKNAFESFIIKN